MPLAANELEKKMFHLIHKVNPDLFAEYDDPLKTLLHLRVLHIPALCRGFLNNEVERNEAEILWLAEPLCDATGGESRLSPLVLDAIARRIAKRSQQPLRQEREYHGACSRFTGH